jgi:3-oxoacyl-[acyl-carrier protein] reductase
MTAALQGRGMNIDLSNRVAVVTGATGELGRVIVRSLSTAGAAVAINYLSNRERAEQLAGEFRAAGRRCMTVGADVTSEKEVREMQKRISGELGKADIIVCNAVSQYSWTKVIDQPVADFENQFRSCVQHAVLMAQAFVPDMIANSYGRVIGINTECSMQNFEGQSAYASAKRGMDGVMRVLAKEVGQHGITVNQVAPGWMISDKYRGETKQDSTEYEKRVPMRRRGQDQDIASAVAFLASDLASFITGCYLPVCGGNVMPAI